MDWIVHPAQRLRGEIVTPADKSITHRAIMFSAIAEGTSVVENYLAAEDCMSTLEAFRALGVAAERTPGTLTIHGKGFEGLSAPAGNIDAGNSGTTVRLLSGILAGRDFAVKLVGDESLSRRPMKRVMEPLGMMGARFSARDNNFLPLEIHGTSSLRPLRYISKVASAQVKSCILLAGLQADGETVVEEPLRSRDHTERMLRSCGVDVRVDGTRVAVKGPARLKPLHLKVPGDISSAAFFLVAAAIVPNASVTVRNVGVNPTRDGIIEILKDMKASLKDVASSEVSGEPVADMLMEWSRLSAVRFGAEIMPRLIDEIPILVLAATQAQGTTVISGAGELRVKESDRIKTISTELNKMGAKVRETADGLVIEGPTPLHGAEVESYGDHRIAMTLAVAGLIAEGVTKVNNVDCVTTSFPDFMTLLEGLTQ